MGGFQNGMTRNRSITFNITPGIRGQFGTNDKWKYEVSFNHAQYDSRVTFPEIVISKSNALFLGQQQGVDPATGYAIFNADVRRLYTPLTPAEYRSISVDSLYRPRSWTDTLAASRSTPPTCSSCPPVRSASPSSQRRASRAMNCAPIR